MKNLSASSGVDEGVLERMVGLLAQYGVVGAVLFGSRARGDYSDASDIDVAYWGKIDEAGLWAELELLPTIHKIDLVNFDTLANENMRANILRDGVKLV